MYISCNCFLKKSKLRKNNPIKEILISGIAEPIIREKADELICAWIGLKLFDARRIVVNPEEVIFNL